jgi:hypothetical protein
MRRFCFVLLFLFGSLTTRAQDAITDVFGIVTIDSLEVHIGPDFAYDTIAQLPKFASVTVTERSGSDWLRVNYDNGSGWVFTRYVRLSVDLNTIPNTALPLPRNRNGRVPEEFDLSTPVCDQWSGSFTLEGDVAASEGTLTVTIPALQGSNWYRIYVFAPDSPLRVSGGTYAQFDSTSNVFTIDIIRLPHRTGTFTWMAAPYWTSDATGGAYGYRQQVCPLRVGGTFDRPGATT